MVEFCNICLVELIQCLILSEKVLSMRWDWKKESGALARVEPSNFGENFENISDNVDLDDEELDDQKAFEKWKSEQIDMVTLTANERLQYYRMVKHLEDEVMIRSTHVH